MFDTINSFPNWPYLAIIGSNVFMFVLLITDKQMDAQINKTVIFSDPYPEYQHDPFETYIFDRILSPMTHKFLIIQKQMNYDLCPQAMEVITLYFNPRGFVHNDVT